jgi:hypothetical protein
VWYDSACGCPVLPPYLSTCRSAGTSPDTRRRAAAFTLCAVLAEGCAEQFRKRLGQVRHAQQQWWRVLRLQTCKTVSSLSAEHQACVDRLEHCFVRAQAVLFVCDSCTAF